ncbi:MAG: hypothetical protein U1E47_01180 [Rivihabitans pingtungensis]|jgi:hypothetical protein|uniref:hypothetical protein n=1 Tax=Rivihabitans pingtungensis TaxID=1054498 RepID=UPI0023556BC8|nr:hypothetical protein [Rivihabitans pingtungensis]MCK6436613.1 hypothetical protein [Rivihabitans pingtungensis]
MKIRKRRIGWVTSVEPITDAAHSVAVAQARVEAFATNTKSRFVKTLGLRPDPDLDHSGGVFAGKTKKHLLASKIRG